MAKAIIDEQNLTDIADAIRAKNGSADTYTPSEMATAIGDLPSGLPIFEYYEITADTATVSMPDAMNWMKSLISEYAGETPISMAIMNYVGNNPADRQFVQGVVNSTTVPVTVPNNNAFAYRWRNGNFYLTTIQPVYDGIVNIGDKYILVLVRAELFV